MTTLAEHMIVAGAENHPPMFDKSMYNSWQSRMLLYIKGKKNDRMMLESIENGPLVYPTIKENRQIHKKKYVELTKQEQFQDDWDVQATNIVLQERECKLYNEFDKFTSVKGESLHEYYLRFVHDNAASSGLAVPSFLPGDDPIACLNKAMAFMSTMMASHFPLTNNQLRTSSNPRNQATIQDGRVTVQQAQGRQDVIATQTTIPLNVAFQTDDLDAYDSDCDDISSAKAVLMANLSSYDSDVISEDKVNQETKTVNESLTAELERYKERVKTFEQRLNVDLNSRQSAQTVHMLTELQSFYDATHKQALSNQNPFYHKKAQRIKPTLYDGFVISKKHDVFSVVDEEETLILEEESR
ncbi:hypothetical protein Tco_1015230 [Tanacetum coccineum]|uniref:Uncharacterized protein n=1 Tax=Tanacetum coccineum TaxID=301880 RepID=A0ABQ5FLB6_9ASTR